MKMSESAGRGRGKSNSYRSRGYVRDIGREYRIHPHGSEKTLLAFSRL